MKSPFRCYVKAYDFDAVVYTANDTSVVLCVACLPPGITINDRSVYPIFADSEWDSAPVCDRCGKQHDYVNLTNEGASHGR